MSITPSKDLLEEIYKRLIETNDPCNWWPIKYDSLSTDGFEISVGAILVQNTSWHNAELALDQLNQAGLWGYQAVYDCKLADLASVIRPCGYYNIKAKKLQSFAQFVVEEFNGDDTKLFAQKIHELRTQLLGIYGIGEETADDIILYAAKKPSFVIDAYTRRVIDRLGVYVAGKTYTDYQNMFEMNLAPNAELWGEFHAQIDKHAAMICTKRSPMCNECVLLDLCENGRVNTD
ncbi:MAG: hypothetical protein FI699_07275 [SAR202 cluster bacterium]|nr:endonuclease [Chloroflexota bacterium]MQG88653.1 hypothetical protein [SAR202 cluster bacterium]|tara:strand:- start:78 stop:776 length:699 start_codon:yes stop_codon:yes gene_type:complete